MKELASHGTTARTGWDTAARVLLVLSVVAMPLALLGFIVVTGSEPMPTGNHRLVRLIGMVVTTVVSGGAGIVFGTVGLLIQCVRRRWAAVLTGVTLVYWAGIAILYGWTHL